MIVLKSLIIATELVLHITSIVMVGLLATEYQAALLRYTKLPTQQRTSADRALWQTQKRNYLRLFGTALLIVTWLLVAYFMNTQEFWQAQLAHVLIIATSLVVLYPIAKEARGISWWIVVVFYGATIVHIALNLLSLFDHYLFWESLALALLKTTQVVALYFFVLRYLISARYVKNT